MHKITKPLLTIKTIDGETYHKEATKEEYEKFKQIANSLTELKTEEGVNIRLTSITKVAYATELECFYFYELPKKPKYLQEEFKRAIYWQGNKAKNLTTKQLRSWFERKETENGYYK